MKYNGETYIEVESNTLFDEFLRRIAKAKDVETIEAIENEMEVADEQKAIGYLDFSRLRLIASIAKSDLTWKSTAKEVAS